MRCEGGDHVSSCMYPFPSAHDSLTNAFYLIAARDSSDRNKVGGAAEWYHQLC